MSQLYPRGAFTVFLNQEAAVLERKCIQVAFDNGREDLFLLRVIFGTAIHETVFLPRMSMEITIKYKLPLFLHPFNHLFGVKNGRMKLFIGIYPLPVEVNQAEVASIVTYYYSIWVEHWNYLEDEILSKYLGDICVT